MKTAIILHGTLGSPDSNWFQWLKNELEQRGLTVWLPQLPQAEQPSLRNNDPSDAQIGDLVFYDWGQGEGISHVAVVTRVDPSGYLEVTDWSTNPKDGTIPSPVTTRGVTYSAVNNEWLQQEYPNVSAHLLHIDTTGSPGNP